MDAVYLNKYKSLLHKARTERLNIQINSTPVEIKKEVKPGGLFKSNRFANSHAAVVTRRNLKVGENIQKTVDALQKGLAEHTVKKIKKKEPNNGNKNI